MMRLSACTPFRFVSLLCIVVLSSACFPDFMAKKSVLSKPKQSTPQNIPYPDTRDINMLWKNPDWAKIPNQHWKRTNIIRVIPIVRPIYPVVVNVVLEGKLAHPCEQIEEIQTQRKETLYQLAVFSSLADKTCGLIETTFQITVPLLADYNKAGFYQVEVNGKTNWFELMVDNDL